MSLVFANGCFDLLHAGHLAYLEWAASLGDSLFVGVNSDASVRRRKGSGHPVIPEHERLALVRALRCVSSARLFDEDTPEELIRQVKPDVLAVGNEYPLDEPHCLLVKAVHRCPVFAVRERTSDILRRVPATKESADSDATAATSVDTGRATCL